MGILSAAIAEANSRYVTQEFAATREAIVALLDDVEPRRLAQAVLVEFDELGKRIDMAVGSE